MEIMKRLVIIGAGGHGKVIADIATKNGYQEIIFLDDDPLIKDCTGFEVAGTLNDCINYKKWDFIVEVGNAKIREQIQEKLSEYNIVTLIHPGAIISRRVSVGKGTVVMAGAVVNSDTVIGKGCIINTGATVDHDCMIGDYVHISVGTHIAGTVRIGEKTWIGAGAVVSNNISICSDCMVGAGAVVVEDIEKSGKYVGIPARQLFN